MGYEIEVLKKELIRRQRADRAYSLRSFARDLELHAGTLSSVLRNKRKLSKKALNHIAGALRLSPKEGAKLRGETLDAQTLELGETHYQIIAEWEHYALLNLIETDDFRYDLDWIATRLSISRIWVETAIERLARAGLIKIDSVLGIQRTVGRLRTSEDVTSTALLAAHSEELSLAREKLTHVPIEKRDYSSTTVAIDPKNLPRAKKLIRKFRRDLSLIMKTGARTEVYQLCIQLFPLTNSVYQNPVHGKGSGT